MSSPTDWVDAYVAWASKRSPLTPPHFHEGIAYTLAACAIAGSICVQTPQGRIYPNLYTLLLGKTSVYAKSVAMDLSQEAAEASMITDRIINSVFTPESIVGELSGETPTNLKNLTQDLQTRWTDSARWKACRMFRLDEAGVFFNSLKREYNAGMQDLWMKLYDCPPTVERTTYKHGLHVIQQPVLSCLFATTPASIGPMLRDNSMWLQGFWPRWNFCVGAGYPEFVHSAFEKPNQSVQKPLFDLGNSKFGRWSADDPLVIPVDSDVVNDYETTLEANRKRTFENTDVYMEAALGRLHTKRMKLALILAALAPVEAEQMRITADFWAATEKPVRQIESDMVEALRQCRNTEKANLEERILRMVRAKGGRLSLRELQRSTGLSISELDPVMTGLANVGLIDVVDVGKSKVVVLTD